MSKQEVKNNNENQIIQNTRIPVTSRKDFSLMKTI